MSEQDMATPNMPQSQEEIKNEDEQMQNSNQDDMQKVHIEENQDENPNNIHISKKSYKHPDKNTQGRNGIMKNGPFYGYPCCCFFWFSKKVEPKTEVKCIPKSMKKKKGNDSDSESVPTDSDDQNSQGHDQEYQQLAGFDYRVCKRCKRNVDEFFACAECNTVKCLDCHKEPTKIYGCLCCAIDPGKVEKQARKKAKEGYDEVCEQTTEMFRQLQGDDKESEEEKTEHLNSLFAQFDSDGSGHLSLSELQDFLGNYIKENFGSKLQKAAEKYDEVSDEFWESVYGELDKDGDGQITPEEFLIVIVDIFKKMSKKMFHSIKVAYKQLLEEIDEIDGN